MIIQTLKQIWKLYRCAIKTDASTLQKNTKFTNTYKKLLIMAWTISWCANRSKYMIQQYPYARKINDCQPLKRYPLRCKLFVNNVIVSKFLKSRMFIRVFSELCSIFKDLNLSYYLKGRVTKTSNEARYNEVTDGYERYF